MATAPLHHKSFNVDAPYRTILRLALPTVFAMLSQSIVNDIDGVFFAYLPSPESSNSQAALLPSLIVVWLFGGSLSAISVGTQAFTARRFAEGNREAAGAVLANGAWFCLLGGAFLSILGFVTLPFILGLMVRGEVLDIAVRYSRWRLLGVISMAMTMAIKAFFDGIGRTHVHLVAAVLMNVINVALCWAFIFGNFGMPRMGAPGAGLSAFLSTWVGLAIMVFYASLVRRDFKPVRWGNLSRGLTWAILKLSFPAAIATVTIMVGFGLFSRVVGLLDRAAETAGVAGEAVYSAATTDIVLVLKLTFTACIAFGTGAATLVSQSLGAKRPEDAARYGWASVRLGLIVFGAVGLCEGILFTRQIVAFVSHSELVREAATVPMRMMGGITPVIAVAMILSEALFGAGNTKFVALAQLLLIFVFLVPLAYVLGILLNLRLVGIWGAACVYCALAAVTMSVKFRQGSWKMIRL